MRPQLTHERRFASRNGGRASRFGSRDPRQARKESAPEQRPVKLSILMPVYNEAPTIEHAIEAVLSTEFPCDFELIVVDDGSTDGTAQKLKALDDPRAVVHRHPRNLGKGAALHTGTSVATGTHIVPFDADLEYTPDDLPLLLEPVLEGRCDIVFGTRLFGANTMYLSYRHAMGNRMLTLAANLMFDAYLSDMHTCLKLLPLELFKMMELEEHGFGLDTEITAKILKTGLRPFEIPVTYHSRSFAHGKKLTWRHGIECLRVLARVRLAPVPRPVLRDTEFHAAPEISAAEAERELAGAGSAHESAAR
jgi:glycosyltransferase involved in cell wall biosynthesis